MTVTHASPATHNCIAGIRDCIKRNGRVRVGREGNQTKTLKHSYVCVCGEGRVRGMGNDAFLRSAHWQLSTSRDAHTQHTVQ